VIVRVRQATPEDVLPLVALFQEPDRLQADWRVSTPRPGFYDEVGAKYREAMANQALVLVAETTRARLSGGLRQAHIPSRFSDERALEISGVVVRADTAVAGRHELVPRPPGTAERRRRSSSRPSPRTRAPWPSGRASASRHGSSSSRPRRQRCWSTLPWSSPCRAIRWRCPRMM
jgi:hypothetical protein